MPQPGRPRGHRSRGDAIDYLPTHSDVGVWGNTYANPTERFLAGLAYLGGEKPSLIFTSRRTFESDASGGKYRSQSNHNLSVADLDRDQEGEIVFGSMTIDGNENDNNGALGCRA